MLTRYHLYIREFDGDFSPVVLSTICTCVKCGEPFEMDEFVEGVGKGRVISRCTNYVIYMGYSTCNIHINQRKNNDEDYRN